MAPVKQKCPLTRIQLVTFTLKLHSLLPNKLPKLPPITDAWKTPHIALSTIVLKSYLSWVLKC